MLFRAEIYGSNWTEIDIKKCNKKVAVSICPSYIG
jgi:hypothetical protein